MLLKCTKHSEGGRVGSMKYLNNFNFGGENFLCDGAGKKHFKSIVKYNY